MILLRVEFEGSVGDPLECTVILAVSYFVSGSAPLHTKVPAAMLDYVLPDAKLKPCVCVSVCAWGWAHIKQNTTAAQRTRTLIIISK